MDIGLDERTLRRIIARLVSFAMLAECAAGRSLPVRWLVLAILRHAEGVVFDHLAETTGWDWASCFEDEPEGGSGPADAAILACRLRMLAAMLGALLLPENCFDDLDGWLASHDVAVRGRVSRVLSGLGTPRAWSPYAPDTS
ncbi:hypothetical protein EJC49_13015 [Aquibium carbonis]|uniref:Uncharacterized protein n=1 Tax=Aquibium carbonis TaxID=2495581 RepID=A0A3R9YET8_9HYPH|nr:hypothetical protein [Aquibium carbonis]RST85974.1 hypothetical protein EJC49_13015 [Aquibium carbonis]